MEFKQGLIGHSRELSFACDVMDVLEFTSGWLRRTRGFKGSKNALVEEGALNVCVCMLGRKGGNGGTVQVDLGCLVGRTGYGRRKITIITKKTSIHYESWHLAHKVKSVLLSSRVRAT